MVVSLFKAQIHLVQRSNALQLGRTNIRSLLFNTFGIFELTKFVGLYDCKGGGSEGGRGGD